MLKARAEEYEARLGICQDVVIESQMADEEVRYELVVDLDRDEYGVKRKGQVVDEKVRGVSEEWL